MTNERTIPGSHVPPTAAEWAVFSELALVHRGRAYALPLSSIKRRTGFCERAIKQAVEGLRLRHNVPVGSSREKPEGYFLIESAEDLETTVKPYFSQAVQMMRVVHALHGRKHRRLRELLGQMQIEIEKETAA